MVWTEDRFQHWVWFVTTSPRSSGRPVQQFGEVCRSESLCPVSAAWPLIPVADTKVGAAEAVVGLQDHHTFDISGDDLVSRGCQTDASASVNITYAACLTDDLVHMAIPNAFSAMAEAVRQHAEQLWCSLEGFDSHNALGGELTVNDAHVALVPAPDLAVVVDECSVVRAAFVRMSNAAKAVLAAERRRAEVAASFLRRPRPPCFQRFKRSMREKQWEDALAEFAAEWAGTVADYGHGLRDLPLQHLLRCEDRRQTTGPARASWVALACAIMVAYPEAARECGANGWYPLYWLCSGSKIPEAVTVKILRIFPDVVRVQNEHSGQLPLDMANVMMYGSTDAIALAVLRAYPEAAGQPRVFAAALCGMEDISQRLFSDLLLHCSSIVDVVRDLCVRALRQVNNAQQPAALTLKWSGMLLFLGHAYLQGFGDLASEAGTLALFSLTLEQRGTLDGLATVISFGPFTMQNIEAAGAILLENRQPSGCARLLQAWHHGEALHACLCKLSLRQVLLDPVATAVTDMIYGTCPHAACSCHRVVAQWEQAVVQAREIRVFRVAWDSVAYQAWFRQAWYGSCYGPSSANRLGRAAG